MRFLALATVWLTVAGISGLAETSFAEGKPAAGAEMARITIGAILPLTGPQAAYGKEAMRGVDLALEQLAQTDATLAQHVKIVTVDDQSTAEGATKAAESLLEKDRTHVLFGSMTAASSAAIGVVARKYKRPLVSPVATTTALTSEGFIFRTCFSEEFQGSLLAAFALKELKQKRALTLRDDTDEARILSERFKKTFEQGGGKLVSEVTYPFGTTDFAKYFETIKAKKASLVLLPAYYQTAAEIMKQAHVNGLKVTFLGGDSWDTPALAKLAGEGATGHYFTTHFSMQNADPKVKEFVDAFKAKYGRDPGSVAALSFDGINLVFDAIKRANTTLKKPLYAAFMRTRDLPGVTGTVTLRESGEAVKSAVIKEIKPEGTVFRAEVKPRVKAEGH